MTIIDVLGVSLYVILWNESHQSKIILINGIIYHVYGLFYDNKYLIYLRNYDITINFSIIIFNLIYYPDTTNYIIGSGSIFLLNSEIIPRYYKTEIIKSIIHVLFVQWVGLYVLYNLTIGI